MKHFKEAHSNMVFGQFLPNKLTDPDAIHALKKVWREDFVPEAVRSLSYSDQLLPLSSTRQMLSALSFMRLLQGAEVSRKEHILHVGAATGYGSMVLSYLGKTVVALEEDKDLFAQLSENIEASSASNITLAQGSMTQGAATQGPYELIIVEGIIEETPHILLEQLMDGGRLLAFEPLNDSSNINLSRACQYKKVGNSYAKTSLFEALAPVLPAFKTPQQFKL